MSAIDYGTAGHEMIADGINRYGWMPVHESPRQALKLRGISAPTKVPMPVFRTVPTVHEQILRNHGQDAATLARRGGLSPWEMKAALYLRPLLPAEDDAEALKTVIAWFRGWGWVPWTLDDALAGDVDAIEEQVRQMVGAVNNVNTIMHPGDTFVTKETLDDVATAVRLAVDGEGRVRQPIVSDWFKAGQGVEVKVTRVVPHPFASPSSETGREQKYADRAMLSITSQASELNASPPALAIRPTSSLYMSPPALALLAWARRRG